MTDLTDAIAAVRARRIALEARQRGLHDRTLRNREFAALFDRIGELVSIEDRLRREQGTVEARPALVAD